VHAALLIATAVAAVINWWSRISGNATAETWSKPLTTVLVIGIALVSGAPSDQVVVAVIALGLCLLGDIFLMSVVDKFVLGLASFLLGHLVFIVLFVKYGLESSTLAGLALILAALLGASIGRVIVQGATFADRTLQKPVLAYLVVIMAMAVVGWSTTMPWVVAGTTLFVISDSILGWHQFVGQKKWMSPAVMITYHGAIAALALSLW
jgi:alkenylglycerophosphocholine/alkenylglycerophosphoethanolamine hydrolase